MPRLATTNLNRVMITGTVAICAVLSMTVLALLALHPVQLNSDFMAFWSFPRFAATHPIAQIYNAGALQAYQAQIYPGFGSFYPFLYPPTFLLPSWWLKFLPFGPAEIIWSLCGLALLIPATMALFPDRAASLMVAILASPASLLNFMTGETAYFTTALLFFGLAALPRRPALAGLAFGLLTLKPQLGVLIPILLLARGEWRGILTACLTAAALILLSCLVFPPGLWLLWFHTLPSYQAQYFKALVLNLNIIVTPAANLVTLGLPLTAAWAVQAGCAALAAAMLFLAARRAPYGLVAALLITGSFLAVPHAYAYDSLSLTAAMALFLRPATPSWQVAFGCLLYLAHLLLLTPWHRAFLYAGPEAVLFGLIAALALVRPQGAISRHEPDHLSAAQP